MTARMRTDEVWNDLLVETLFLVNLVKDALELVEQIERRLAHELQNLRTGMLRCYLQSAAHMLGNQLAGVFPCRLIHLLILALVQQQVVTHTTAYKALLDTRQGIHGMVNLQQLAVGGIEASLRRISHYDYWKDELRKCILCDSGADLILYGMGERSIVELANAFAEGKTMDQIHEMPQVAFYCKEKDIPGGFKDDDIILHSHEECLHNKKGQAENVRHLEEEANKMHAQRMIQETDGKYVVVNPPFPLITTEELDAAFDLPYTRLPHPKYKGKTIPAYEMIKFSVNLHRGCFGGCSFCTISAHQGKFVVCRSKESILKEVKKIIEMPDFKGYLSDLGGPSANMYGMHGKNLKACEVCKRPSCVNPQICPNLNTAQCHRYIGIEFLQYLGIDDRWIVGAHVVAGVRTEGILAAHTAIGRVAVYHRVHGSRRYAEEEARATQLLEVTEVAVPVGLRNDGHAVAVRLQDSSQDGSSEGWVIHVGITREEDYIQFVPASEFALLLGSWQEIC